LIEILLTIIMVAIPQTITVRVTGEKECYDRMPYTVQEIDFKEYVKGVMMNEFGVQHPIYGAGGERLYIQQHSDETLEAAAMVIKNYALHQYYRGGKWGGYEYGIVYDCDWDMVYNPNIRNPRTDKAVDDTWDLVVLDRSGDILQTHFLALPATCDWHFGVGKCLGAWQYGGIFQQGDRGWTMEEMLYDAYHDIKIVPRYLQFEIFGHIPK
jgi:hypothetical protein